MSVRTGLLAGAAIFATAWLNAAPANAAHQADAGWTMNGHDYSNTRFSPLTQINVKNVAHLKLAYSLHSARCAVANRRPSSLATRCMCPPGRPGYVYALDAATGARKWVYEPDIPDDVLQYACCDVNNRGVTYADGKIFVGRLDGNLSAVDAKTGAELWTTKVVDYKQGSVITSPPLIVHGKVITGFGGGEYGARGSLQAYDENTGKQIWKTWTVPGPGEPGNDTWKGDSWKHGGAAGWLVGSYDEKTNTRVLRLLKPKPVEFRCPQHRKRRLRQTVKPVLRQHVAFDADTGAIKWHFQATPEDAWDYDGVNELVLADLKIRARPCRP